MSTPACSQLSCFFPDASLGLQLPCHCFSPVMRTMTSWQSSQSCWLQVPAIQLGPADTASRSRFEMGGPEQREPALEPQLVPAPEHAVQPIWQPWHHLDARLSATLKPHCVPRPLPGLDLKLATAQHERSCPSISAQAQWHLA